MGLNELLVAARNGNGLIYEHFKNSGKEMFSYKKYLLIWHLKQRQGLESGFWSWTGKMTLVLYYNCKYSEQRKKLSL